MMRKIIWIIIEDVFEGSVDHWADCFFSNPSVEDITEFCALHEWEVEFLEEIPDEFKSKYDVKKLKILPFEKHQD